MPKYTVNNKTTTLNLKAQNNDPGTMGVSAVDFSSTVKGLAQERCVGVIIN